MAKRKKVRKDDILLKFVALFKITLVFWLQFVQN